MKKAYIFLADGFEVIEALAPYDVFCRAGINVKTVSISNNRRVAASNKIVVEADYLLSEVDDFDTADLLYLPGGYPGFENLGNNSTVGLLAKQHYQNGKILAAICGAPTVLLKNNIAYGKTVTSHSCCKTEMQQHYKYTGNAIERDGNLLTCIGAGHSIDFAICLAQILEGNDAVKKIKTGMELEN